MQLLFGRTLRPSHGPSFTAAWTSSLAATRASHSAQPASDSAPKTQDTSGRTSAEELTLFDLGSVSSKTSKDTLPSGCVTFCTTWASWVTERRLAFSARLKSARRTSEKESSSWPSPNAQVSQDGESPETWLRRKEAMKAKGYNGNGCGTPLTIAVQLHGQAAPASSSSIGSRQGWWGTPRATEAKLGRHYTPGMTGKDLTKDVMQWATPQAHDAQGPKTPEQIAAMRAKGHGVKNLNEQACWGAPTARDHKSGRGNEDRQYKELTPMVERQQSGKLNPRWVETLMGLPIGWTMPSCTSPLTIAPTSCDSSATESCLPPQSELSEFSLAS
jgi:hypothetical protein